MMSEDVRQLAKYSAFFQLEKIVMLCCAVGFTIELKIVHTQRVSYSARLVKFNEKLLCVIHIYIFENVHKYIHFIKSKEYEE